MSRMLPIVSPPLTIFSGAHHDGSALYVSNPYPTVGQIVQLRVRVGADLAVRGVHVRTTLDGDQHFIRCTRQGLSEWWVAAVRVSNLRLGYRFLIDAAAGAVTLNASGLHEHEVTDAQDFRITTDPAPPEWARQAVFYEIFPDRFARASTAPGEPLPEWAVPAEWGDEVAAGTPEGVLQVYRGDLDGVREHLDHLVAVGISAIYLTPVFPGMSNHRYDASTFERVDPLLGGDRALQELVDEAHERGLRVIGDLTLNHTGDNHEWFTAAQVDSSSVEAGFYIFAGHPHRYATFAGVESMPKLDHGSVELRRRLFEGPDSVVDRYLRQPGLDGWRIDVAQSAGHHGQSNRTLKTARATVATARHARADAYVVAEHQFDASQALAGDGWHGTISYAGFTRPVWSWLAEADIDRYWGVPACHRAYTGTAMARVMDSFAAAIPWRSRIHSLNLLDSHDTPRFLSVVGRDRYAVGLGLLVSLPGIPMLFAGDEIGATGRDLEEARQPFQWDPATWDQDLLQMHRRLIALRRTHPALTDGGFRWVHTADDVVVFERATQEQTILVQAARRAHTPLVCPVPAMDLIGDRHLRAGQTLPHHAGGFGAWQLLQDQNGQGGW